MSQEKVPSSARVYISVVGGLGVVGLFLIRFRLYLMELLNSGKVEPGRPAPHPMPLAKSLCPSDGQARWPHRSELSCLIPNSAPPSQHLGGPALTQLGKERWEINSGIDPERATGEEPETEPLQGVSTEQSGLRRPGKLMLI